MFSNHSLAALNDQALLSQFSDLVRQDREGKANLLRHIDVIDQRKLWARLGHPTLFDFLVARHHMSEATAFKRIGAARTARRFPILFAMVARGEIHLSGIHRLKAHLTRENHEQVLAEAKHKSIRQIEALVARLAPRPDVPTTLRALPNRTPLSQTLAAPTPAAATLVAPATVAPALAAPASVAPATVAPALAAPASVAPALAAPASVAPALAAPASVAPVSVAPATVAPTAPVARVALAPATVTSASAPLPPRRDPDPEPLAPGRYKLTLTISENTRTKLKQLEDLLAYKIPKGDASAILDRALDALLTEVQKRKIGSTAKPRASRVTQPTAGGQHTRHVRASVRREVWPRDQGRCGFLGEDGHRCNETRGLQFAHKEPWAKGGENTAENLGLRCRAHNALEADRDYGTDFMANKRQQKPLKVRESVARYGLASCGRPP